MKDGSKRALRKALGSEPRVEGTPRGKQRAAASAQRRSGRGRDRAERSPADAAQPPMPPPCRQQGLGHRRAPLTFELCQGALQLLVLLRVAAHQRRGARPCADY